MDEEIKMGKAKRQLLFGKAATAGIGLKGLITLSKAKARVRANLKTTGKQPNILLILTDQERAWDMLPEGFIDQHCPGRKALRDSSVYYSRAHAPSQLCSMARAIIYSGTHPGMNGLWDNVPLPYASNMSEDVPTLGTMFQDAGYHTAYYGKWHLSRLYVRNGPLFTADQVHQEFAKYGFSETDCDTELDGAWGGFLHDEQTAQSVAKFFERSKSSTKPWFTAVNIVNPHDIMYYTTGDEMTRGRKIQFPDRNTRPPDIELYQKNLGYDLQLGYSTYQHDPKTKPEAVHEFKLMMDIVLGEIDYQNKDFGLEFQNYYYNCIIDSDRHIQKILSALEASGQADNTIVMLTSDHGEMLGSKGLRGKGTTAYKEATNIPLTVRIPGGLKAQVSTANVSQIDIAPTLLSMAGIDLNDAKAAYGTLVGRDFSAAVKDPKNKGQRASDGTLLHWTAFCFQDHTSAIAVERLRLQKKNTPIRIFMLKEMRQAMRRRGQMRSIVTEQYKFVRYFSPKEHHVPHDFETLLQYNDLELFDLQADPQELKNLGAEPDKHRALITELNTQLNLLIAQEMGEDKGNYMPGPNGMWNL
jgi:arylsulfatase A-like enzyme